MSRNNSKEEPSPIRGNNVKADNRPSDYEYAVISKHIYRKYITEGLLTLDIPGNNIWRIHTTRTADCGYFGAIYVCDKTKQVVVAHRGTNSIKDIFEDIRGIFFNQTTPQKGEALFIIRQAIELVRKHPDYHLSATGHSLGAFLAEFTVYFVVTNFTDLHNVNAVTFESPGSLEQIKSLLPDTAAVDFVLPKLDIISYFGYPNLINTCNGHIGTKYMINVDLGPFGWWPVHHLLKSHSSKGITEWFEQSATADQAFNKRRSFMNDWPKGYFQKNVYFKYADFENGRYTIVEDIKHILTKNRMKRANEAEDVDNMKAHEKTFKLKFKGNFKICPELSVHNIIPMQHLFLEFQNFIREFHAKILTITVKNKNHKEEITDVLVGVWKKLGISETIISCLKDLKITKHKYAIEALDVGFGKDVSVFRRKFSNWLEKNNEITVEDLVPDHIKLYFNIRQNHIDGIYMDSEEKTQTLTKTASLSI